MCQFTCCLVNILHYSGMCYSTGYFHMGKAEGCICVMEGWGAAQCFHGNWEIPVTHIQGFISQLFILLASSLDELPHSVSHFLTYEHAPFSLLVSFCSLGPFVFAFQFSCLYSSCCLSIHLFYTSLSPPLSRFLSC